MNNNTDNIKTGLLLELFLKSWEDFLSVLKFFFTSKPQINAGINPKYVEKENLPPIFSGDVKICRNCFFNPIWCN